MIGGNPFPSQQTMNSVQIQTFSAYAPAIDVTITGTALNATTFYKNGRMLLSISVTATENTAPSLLTTYGFLIGFGLVVPVTDLTAAPIPPVPPLMSACIPAIVTRSLDAVTCSVYLGEAVPTTADGEPTGDPAAGSYIAWLYIVGQEVVPVKIGTIKIV